MKEYAAFSELLSMFREERGLTQKDIAGSCEISQSQMSQLEAGKYRPKPELVECLSNALQLEASQKKRLMLAAGFVTDDDRISEIVTPPEFLSVLTALGDPAVNDLPGPLARDAVKEFVDSWHLYAHAKEKQYKREWKGTEEVCEDAVAKLHRAANRLEAYLLDAMGSAALHLGNLTEAERRFQHVERLLEDFDDPYLEGQLLAHQGEILRVLSDWNQAELKFQAANKVFLGLEDKTKWTKSAWIDRKLGLLYLFQGEWDKALRYLERSENVFKEIDDTYELAKTNLTLGWAYTMKGDWDKAWDYRRKGYNLSQNYKVMGQEPDVFLQMQAYVYMGLTLHQLGSLDEGREYLEKAQDISDRLQEMHERSTILVGLGLVYFDLYNQSGEENDSLLQKAHRYFETAARETRATGDRRRHARSLTYWSTLYLKPGQVDRAIDLLEEARRIFRALEHHYFLATVAIYLGRAYLKTGALGPLNVCVNEGIQEAQMYRYPHYRQLSELRILKAQWACHTLGKEEGRDETVAKHLADAIADAILFNRFQCEKISDQIVDTLSCTRSSSREISKLVRLIQKNFVVRINRDEPFSQDTSPERLALVDDVNAWFGELRNSSSARFPKRALDELQCLING